MDYTRRELLGLAVAGASVAALPLFAREEAYAEDAPPPTRAASQGPGKSDKVLDLGKEYKQSKADKIHERSVEKEIEKEGEVPEEVKEKVEEKMKSLKEDLSENENVPPQVREKVSRKLSEVLQRL